MTLKVLLAQKTVPDKLDFTDWALLGKNTPKGQQLQLNLSTTVMVPPAQEQTGMIRIHHQKLPLYSDNTFFYGAWPQNQVNSPLNKTLNTLLLGKKIRCDGNYYTLNQTAYQEYEYQGHRYVLVHDAHTWMEVLPIAWRFDPKSNTAHTQKVIVADDNLDALFFEKMGWQALQSNKFCREHFSQVSPKKEPNVRELTATLLKDLRLLRDVEKGQGNVSPFTQQVYGIFQKHFVKRKTKV